jgi:hypothetical protein
MPVPSSIVVAVAIVVVVVVGSAAATKVGITEVASVNFGVCARGDAGVELSHDACEITETHSDQTGALLPLTLLYLRKSVLTRLGRCYS